MVARAANFGREALRHRFAARRISRIPQSPNRHRDSLCEAQRLAKLR